MLHSGLKLVRVASYNIRKAVGLDWRRNGNRIVDVLAEIDADIVLLQEADKRVGQRSGVLPEDRLAQELGYHFADVSVRPQSHGWHGNAILYRKTATSDPVPKRIDLPTIEPRGAVAARFAAPDIEVIGVHLGLSRGVRAKQLAALNLHMNTADHPVLVAGDFNIWKNNNGSALLGDTMIAPGNSFHTSRPTAQLDRFALKGNVRCLSSRVHTSALATRASDHFPIVIELEIVPPARDDG